MVNDKWVMSWKALLDRRICCSLCSWMKWHDQICIWYRSSWPLWGERRPMVGKWVSYYSSSPFKDPNWGSRNRNWKVKSTTYWSNSSQQNRQVLSTVWHVESRWRVSLGWMTGLMDWNIRVVGSLRLDKTGLVWEEYDSPGVEHVKPGRLVGYQRKRRADRWICRLEAQEIAELEIQHTDWLKITHSDKIKQGERVKRKLRWEREEWQSLAFLHMPASVKGFWLPRVISHSYQGHAAITTCLWALTVHCLES